MKIRPVGAKLFHRTDGRTDTTKLTFAFRNLANAPTNAPDPDCLPLPSHLTDISENFVTNFQHFWQSVSKIFAIPDLANCTRHLRTPNSFTVLKATLTTMCPACTVHGGQALVNTSPPLRWAVCITGSGRGVSYVSCPTFINSKSEELHKWHSIRTAGPQICGQSEHETSRNAVRSRPLCNSVFTWAAEFSETCTIVHIWETFLQNQ